MSETTTVAASVEGAHEGADSAGASATTGAPGRAALLRAMEELAREQGVNNVGLREVARRAGLSHAAPTHFFGSREGMIRALAFEDSPCSTTSSAPPRSGRAPARSRAARRRRARVRCVRATAPRPLRRHVPHSDLGAGRLRLDRARLAALDGLRALVVEVHTAGDIGGDVETAFLQLCAMSHGIASLAVDGLLHGFDELADTEDAAAGVAERIIRAQVEQLP